MCKYCEPELKDYEYIEQESSSFPFYLCIDDPEKISNVELGTTIILGRESVYNYKNYYEVYARTEFKYCPMCGRQLH